MCPCDARKHNIKRLSFRLKNNVPMSQDAFMNDLIYFVTNREMYTSITALISCTFTS